MRKEKKACSSSPFSPIAEGVGTGLGPHLMPSRFSQTMVLNPRILETRQQCRIWSTPNQKLWGWGWGTMGVITGPPIHSDAGGGFENAALMAPS